MTTWQVRLGTVAEIDFASIIRYTSENFGARQARVYRDTLVRAIVELADGPDVHGSRRRDDLAPGVRTLHVARHGRHGRHFLVYRTGRSKLIEIVRILHDQTDLRRHLPLPDRGSDG